MKIKILEKRKQERIAKENRENVLAELPDFTNRLMLLLNAGMVISGAIEKIASEDRNTYFYRELKKISYRMETVNALFQDEFRDFARRTGVRELLRLANIIADNIDKGTELVSKLEAESQFMWHMSKKQVEERGRIAESKLSFPMALMLISLLVVTSAPAFMQM